MVKKMRPTQDVIDKFKKADDLVARNIDNIADDFTQSYSGAEEWVKDSAKQQHLTDLMFSTFVLGLITAISPSSKFNREYMGRMKRA